MAAIANESVLDLHFENLTFELELGNRRDGLTAALKKAFEGVRRISDPLVISGGLGVSVEFRHSELQRRFCMLDMKAQTFLCDLLNRQFARHKVNKIRIWSVPWDALGAHVTLEVSLKERDNVLLVSVVM